MLKNTLITTFAISTLAIAASSQASTYALSTTTINNFTVSGGTVTGWTFSQDLAINGSNVLAGGDISDAPASCVGCSYDNEFFAHGTGSAYAYGDALISSTDVNGSGGSASAIAEIFSTDGISGSAMSSNSMTGYLTVATSGLVSFNFDVIYDLQVATTGSDIGFANMNFDLALYDLSNNNIFSLSPTDFNFGIGPTDDSASLSATGLGGEITMAAGNYKFDVSMTQNVFSNVSAVPVPAAFWLFGSGLLAIAGIAKRKSK
ncbi:MAG: VPLPA-CTERM sorting domain-containing protein [Gammaproteobacteria bacterium]|nr:VPLPA-CTERM sorting domain-containing protein [Gammaproteobacteria bacterium]